MNSLSKLKIERLTRVLADIVLINSALMIALMSYYIWIIAYYGDINTARELFVQFLASHWLHGGLITMVCILVFAISGFYTYGRFYNGRYKALLIIQSVTLSFLIFSFLTYILPRLNNLPRSLLALEWFFTLTFVIGARLWSSIWKNLVQNERHVLKKRIVDEKVRHVLVVGGAGFIGSALIEQMLEHGYYVKLLDKFLYGENAIQTSINHPKLDIIRADFREIHKVVEAMNGIDAVIHLGAIVGDPACALDEELTVEVNLMATKMIAEVAKANRVNRFIFASTCSVYGASDEMLNEQSVLNPVSLYAKSKTASEQILRGMADQDFAPVCVRFGTVYGLSARTRFDLVVNLLTAKAFADRKITVFGGSQWRPFVHVQDAAAAVFKILEAPLELVNNQVFNVGSDEQNYTILEIGEMVKNAVPDAKLTSSEGDGDNRNYRVSFEKIKRVLSFQPKWTVEDGIKQVLQSMQSGNVTDYQETRYNNAKYLSEAGAYQLDKEGNWAQKILDDIQVDVPTTH